MAWSPDVEISEQVEASVPVLECSCCVCTRRTGELVTINCLGVECREANVANSILTWDDLPPASLCNTAGVKPAFTQ